MTKQSFAFILFAVIFSAFCSQAQENQHSMKTIKIPLTETLDSLTNSGGIYIEPFQHGSLEVGMYSPKGADRQQPHDKDEVYVVITGRGDFFCDGKTVKFEPGDVLFVPAHKEHRFENFSDDFNTWVIFYGPKGGEKPED